MEKGSDVVKGFHIRKVPLCRARNRVAAIWSITKDSRTQTMASSGHSMFWVPPRCQAGFTLKSLEGRNGKSYCPIACGL